MRTVTTLTVAALLLQVCGCIIVHPKADTVLTFSRDPASGDSVSVGFPYAVWDANDRGIELIGYGWHPRDHETYAFFRTEPLPAYAPRFLEVESPSGQGPSRIRIVWIYGNAPFHASRWPTPVEYRGQVSHIESAAGKMLTVKLRDVPLYTPDSSVCLFVSGTIRANRERPEVASRMKQRLETEEAAAIRRPYGTANLDAVVKQASCPDELWDADQRPYITITDVLMLPEPADLNDVTRVLGKPSLAIDAPVLGYIAHPKGVYFVSLLPTKEVGWPTGVDPNNMEELIPLAIIHADYYGSKGTYVYPSRLRGQKFTGWAPTP